MPYGRKKIEMFTIDARNRITSESGLQNLCRYVCKLARIVRGQFDCQWFDTNIGFKHGQIRNTCTFFFAFLNCNLSELQSLKWLKIQSALTVRKMIIIQGVKIIMVTDHEATLSISYFLRFTEDVNCNKKNSNRLTSCE